MVAATTALGKRETPSDVIKRHFQSAADRLGLDAEMRALLSRPSREIRTELPVRMDDGTLQIFTAYRVQHCDVRGPYIGGFRLHPRVDIEDLRAMAAATTWKCAVLNVPFGGAFSGVACDAEAMSQAELEVLTRKYASRTHLMMGPYRDVHWPDVNTDAGTMEWMLDEYSHIHEYTPACFTGKPVEMGGTPAYDGATALGLSVLVREAARDLGMQWPGLRVGLQAGGKEATRIALSLARAGCNVVALDDGKCTVTNPAGIDVDALIAHEAIAGSLADYPQAQSAGRFDILECECDVLIPAAYECVVHGRNAGRVKAKLIVEGANLAVTADADDVLNVKGVRVVPDLLGSAGRLIVSYMEWSQNLQQVFKDEGRVNEDLQQMILRGYNAVKERSAQYGTTLRQAAYDIAVGRVARAEALRKV